MEREREREREREHEHDHTCNAFKKVYSMQVCEIETAKRLREIVCVCSADSAFVKRRKCPLSHNIHGLVATQDLNSKPGKAIYMT